MEHQKKCMQKDHHVPTRHSTRLDCHVDKIPYEVLSLVMEKLEKYKQLDTLRAVSRRFKDVSEDIIGRSIQRMQVHMIQQVASAKAEFEEKLQIYLAIRLPLCFNRCTMEMTGTKVQFMQEIQAHFRNLNALLWSRRPACASAYINCGKLLDCVTDAIQKVKEMPAEARFHYECQWKCDLVRKPYALSKLSEETQKNIRIFGPKLSQEMEDYEGSCTVIGHDGVEHTMSGLLLKDACRFIGILDLLENSKLAEMKLSQLHYNETGLVRVKAQYNIENAMFYCRKYNVKSDKFQRVDSVTCVQAVLEKIFEFLGEIVSCSNLEAIKFENYSRCLRFLDPNSVSHEQVCMYYVIGLIDKESKWLVTFDSVSGCTKRFTMDFDFTCAAGLISKNFMEKCGKVMMEVGKVQTFDMLVTSYDPKYKCAEKFAASYKPDSEEDHPE